MNEDVLYREITQSLMTRLVQLIGAAAAINMARKVPDLSVDADGNVLDFNRDDPLQTITLLIAQLNGAFGRASVDLTQQATRATSSSLAESLLQNAGILPVLDSNGIRILLVDDHVLVREGLTSLLAVHIQLQVIGQAGTMAEAIDQTRSLQPDLILMDFELPDGNGEEATRIILSELPATKIVFLTAYEDDDRLFRAIASGAIGYLIKNISAAELIGRLQGVARGEVAISPAIAHRILQGFARLPTATSAEVRTDIGLTEREIEVVRELALGASNREIAKRLVVSESTIKNHVHNVLFKLHLRNREDAVEYARRRGLIPTSPDPS